MTKRSPQELFVLLVPAIAMFAIIVFGERVTIDGDPFWHIAAGGWMLDHGQVIREDVLSYTMAGKPWQAHEWLSEIIMAGTYRLSGLHGLFILLGLTYAATSLLIGRSLLRSLDPVPALIVLGFALACLKSWMMMRPHSFALPILAAWADELLLARSEHRTPRSVILVPLMLAWINLHPSFLFGLALLALFAVESVVEDRRSFTLLLPPILASGAAAFVNPSGIGGVLFPLLFATGGAAGLIPEWQSSTFGSISPLEISLLVGMLVAFSLGVRVPFMRLILLAAILHLTLAHQRFVIVLATLGSMLLAEPIAKALRARGWVSSGDQAVINGRPIFAGAALIAFALAAASFLIPRGIQNENITPVAALSSIPAEIVQQPVFNDWRIGGYMVLQGYKVFIDGRAELYGAEWFRNYLAISEGDYEALSTTLHEYAVVWTILQQRNGANQLLRLMPDWCLHYADSAAVVFIRNDALERANRTCPG